MLFQVMGERIREGAVPGLVDLKQEVSTWPPSTPGVKAVVIGRSPKGLSDIVGEGFDGSGERLRRFTREHLPTKAALLLTP